METQLQQDFKVDFIFSQVISFAMQQNHIPVIRKFIINNSTENDIQNINVDLNFEPEFGNPVSTKILLLKAGESLQINNFDLRLSPKFLSELTERISGSIKLTIQSEDIVLLKNDYLIDVLAFDQWQGLSILPETISSFITPNNPQISKIISRASEILNKWTGNPSLDEYQSRNPDRVKKQMAAVFESVRELGIVYCTSPASFEDSGQRIRMIDMLLNHKLV
jgi:hypothetical protein